MYSSSRLVLASESCIIGSFVVGIIVLANVKGIELAFGLENIGCRPSVAKKKHFFRHTS